MTGSTALDPTKLFRVRARFAPSPSSAECVQIGQVAQDPRRSGALHTVFRELRSGDRVAKGDLLAVFYSVDVGNKKNDLIDAIYQLKLDEEILKAAQTKLESVPAVFLWNAERNVQGDRNTVNRAVAMLQTWGISEDDIQAVRDEAENVKKRGGKHDKSKDELWPRVEIRSPYNGVVVERNLALHEIVVDNTTNLFQIADVEKLFIAANVPEDDLPGTRGTARDVGRRDSLDRDDGRKRPDSRLYRRHRLHYRSEPAHGRCQRIHRQQRRKAAGRTVRSSHSRTPAADRRRRAAHGRRRRRWTTKSLFLSRPTRRNITLRCGACS